MTVRTEAEHVQRMRASEVAEREACRAAGIDPDEADDDNAPVDEDTDRLASKSYKKTFDRGYDQALEAMRNCPKRIARGSFSEERVWDGLGSCGSTANGTELLARIPRSLSVPVS